MYSFASVPAGTYDVRAEGGRCFSPQTQSVTINANTSLTFTLAAHADSFGYTCRIEATNFVDANTVLPLVGDDAAMQVNLPFKFRFYGTNYSKAWISTNGFVNFLASDANFSNSAIPSSVTPNAAIYPFWDDLNVDASASVRTQLVGSRPNRQFVIEWRNVAFFGDATRRVRFEIILQENGDILTEYLDIANDGREQDNSATVGIENREGTVALQYANNEAAITNGLAVRYKKP